MLFAAVMSLRVEVFRTNGLLQNNRLLHGNRHGTKPQFCPLGSLPHGTQLQGTLSQGIQPQVTQSQETQQQANQSQPTQPQLTRTTQGRREVQLNRNDNTLAQGTQGQGTGSTLSIEGDANINSTMLKIQENKQADTVALQTVPIILKYGKKKMLVNCFLDEGSNTPYVNEDIVDELSVKGEKELITANVANDQEVTFPFMSFTIGVESVDECVDAKMVAQPSEIICRGMKAVDWVGIKSNWQHLQDIPFPKLVNQSKIDVLLGTDNYHLMYPKKECLVETGSHVQDYRYVL